MTYSLTGDPLTDALLPIAVQMIGAVHDQDHEHMTDLYAAAEEVTTAIRPDRDQWTALRGLVTDLAALCSEDIVPAQELAWVAQGQEYRRLVAAGVDPHHAAVLAARAQEVA